MDGPRWGFVLEDWVVGTGDRFSQVGRIMVTCRIGAVWTLAALSLVIGSSAVASVDPSGEARGLPKGLATYLEARLLEANGRYREAMDAYDRAVDQAPSVAEVRVSYATFLVELGMASRAVEVLAGVEDLEGDGLRVRALALSQLVTRKPELQAETESALRAALEINEDDPNLLFSLAQLLRSAGSLDEAERVVAGLRESRPENPRLLILHADLLKDLERWDEAVELFRRCAGGGPASASCRENLVAVLVEMDRPGEAGEAMLGWLSDIDLDSLMRAAALLWEGGRLELSLDTVERVLEKAPDSERALSLEAHLLSALGRHQEAVTRLRKLMRKNPNDIDLILAMAWSSGRGGDHEAARKWFGRAWELVADDTGSRQAVRCALTAARLEVIEGYPLVAREWLSRVGDYKLAGRDYVRLLAETYRREEQWRDGTSAMLRLQPSLEGRARIEAQAMEAEFRLRAGDPRAWQRLRPLLDGDDPQHVDLGLQVLQTVERWSDVEREAAAAIERSGARRDLVFARAAALERLDRFEESEELFRTMVEVEPDDANAANYLGYMWANRGVNLEEALDLITRAVAADPENPAYLDSLGWVYYRLGDQEQARYWLERAIDLGGGVGDGTILCHLGEVLIASGEPGEGRRYLQIGLDMGCEDPEHVRSLLETVGDEPE